MDKSGNLAKIINGTIAFAEVLAITKWINLDYYNTDLNNQWKNKVKNSSITANILRFSY